MDRPLANLQPSLVWQHFEEILKVPRPSKHEERIREHVKRWAQTVARVVEEQGEKLAGAFVVVEPGQIRISRKLG